MYLGILKETIQFNLFHVVVLPSALFYFLIDCCKIYVLKRVLILLSSIDVQRLRRRNVAWIIWARLTGLDYLGPSKHLFRESYNR